jgi:hydroxymethylpyrimidine pyrophosphatase-like HAD family hydrolase
MRYLALVCDYDGTLAQDGRVTQATVASLEKLRGSGRKLLLVTGRELEDLLRIFPQVSFFERVVAENGAVLYDPATRATKTLADSPSAAFIDALRKRQVFPLSVGQAIVATWKPHETTVLETIRDLGLELQVIFNKDAVMVLPAGVNKATGLSAALKELELSPHEAVAVGDAENDHALLSFCECGVAVDNALPTVKERADLVMRDDHGRGVEKLIEHLLDTDLQDIQGQLKRHHLLLGHRDSGEEVRLAPYGCNLLIAGPSGSGKSTVSKSFLERLQERHYQFCIIDPEGDYDGLEGAVTIGGSQRGPTIDEILQLLKKPETDVVVNLVGVALADRPPFFLSLLPRLQEMRGRIGRPHWVVVDEAHHLVPAAWVPALSALPQELDRMVFLTVHPDQIAAPALAAVSMILAVGSEPDKTIAQFCAAMGESPPRGYVADPSKVLLWLRRGEIAPFAVKVIPARAEHRRHIRKYAEGELPAERCFYFRGPEQKLNLKAQNLMLFNQIAQGIDDATWLHHLKEGDYSRWFREGIHDDVLADAVEQVEKTAPSSALESRTRIRKLIEQYYTVPATAPLPLPGTIAQSQATSEQTASGLVDQPARPGPKPPNR